MSGFNRFPLHSRRGASGLVANALIVDHLPQDAFATPSSNPGLLVGVAPEQEPVGRGLKIRRAGGAAPYLSAPDDDADAAALAPLRRRFCPSCR